MIARLNPYPVTQCAAPDCARNHEPEGNRRDREYRPHDPHARERTRRRP